MRTEELSHVTGLEVAGLSWGIPRINPQHFRADKSADVIKQAAFIVSKGEIGDSTGLNAVDLCRSILPASFRALVSCMFSDDRVLFIDSELWF